MRKLYDYIIDRLCEGSTWVGIFKIAAACFVYQLIARNPDNADAIVAAINEALKALSAVVAFGGMWNVVKPEPK